MKRFLLVIFTLISISVFAQSETFKVKEGSFHHVQGCVTIPAHTDQNNLPMGVIKIIPDNINEQQRTRLSFEGNLAMGIEVEQHEGETWVYVTARAATFLRIKHPDFGVTEFNIPMEIEANKCYEMTLQYVDSQPELSFLAISSEPSEADIYIDGSHYGKTSNVITDLAVGTHELQLKKDGYVTLTKTFVTTKGETLKLNETLQAIVNKKTYLIVKTDQPNARIYIDDNLISTQEASMTVNVGTTHTYRIECNMYHEESGSVTIEDRTVVDKKLRPAFGYLDIATTPEQGAKAFVDGDYVGITPIKTDKIKSGTHTVMVMKDMYKMNEKTYTVNDGQTTNATLNMAANFVNVTVNTDLQSDIYVDEEYKAKGRWTGRLSDGTHIFEARKANHKTSKKSVDLVLGETKTITVDAPMPIKGEVDINTTPMGATIYIDGKSYGETPNYVSDIIIGEHELKLTKQGCAPITKKIFIKEGETLTINERLLTGKEISISTDQSGDKIYVDGSYVGTSPMTSSLAYGTHEIKAERNGKTVSKTINVSQSGGDNSVKLAFFGTQTFTVKGVSFTMIAVEGGAFKMGATSEQGSDADSDEKPVHHVTLSDYYIGETEVTQELWHAVMGSNPSYFKGNKKPVEQVSWNDCQKFITKLNQITGKNFRLPTEAEWEYAARGGKNSKGYKYSGSNTLGNVAWYTDNSGSSTHDVKTKSANELGIYDMSGNVWEWCQDWYGDYSSSSQTNPTGPTSGSNRVSRGGGWSRNAEGCRVSHRSSSTPGFRGGNLGFRLCLSQD